MPAPQNSLGPILRFAERPYLAWGVLSLVTFLGLWWRLAGIGESLWLDELHTAWTISGDLADVPQRAAFGNYSPAYFLVVGAVVKVFGMTEFALRLPSLLAGVALIPLAYAAIVVWTRSRIAGLLAAWLVAADGIFLLFAQEARPYALIQLLGLIHVLIFWRTLSEPTWRLRAIWISIGILLFYLHYTALLLLVAEVVVYALLFLCGRNRLQYGVLSFLLDTGLIFLACSPAAFHLLEIARRRENWKTFVQQRPLSFVFTQYPFPLIAYVYLPVSFALLAALFRGAVGFRPEFSKFDWRLCVLVAFWLLVPVGVAWLLTHFDVARLLFPRYVIVASLAPILLAGLACASGGDTWTRLALAIVVATAVFLADRAQLHAFPVQPSIFWARYTTRGVENWRDAIHYVNDQTRGSDEPVFVQSGIIEADTLEQDSDAQQRAYCLFPVATAIYPLDADEREIWPLRSSRRLFADPDWLRDAADRGGAWLIVRGPLRWSEQTHKRFTQAAAANGLNADLTDQKYFMGVVVYRLTVVTK